MIKGILFDKDGTLIEFEMLWHKIIGNVFKGLVTRYMISLDTIGKLKLVSGYLEDVFTKESIIQYYATSQIVDLWISIINEEHKLVNSRISYNELMELFDEEASSEALVIEAIDGVKDLLIYLKAKGYVIGIATADTKVSTYHGLEKSGIFQYFDYIGCNEDGVMPKPSADMAHRFCREHNLKEDELLIVGDSVTDMEFADNAKALFIGIRTNYNNYEEYHRCNKLTVDKIQDIIHVLKL